MVANIHKVADVRFMHQNIFRNRFFLPQDGRQLICQLADTKPSSNVPEVSR